MDKSEYPSTTTGESVANLTPIAIYLTTIPKDPVASTTLTEYSDGTAS